ncbi:aldehyde ferredoxin oxidoreductase family protein [Thermodesulfobacteriota bacterium]
MFGFHNRLLQINATQNSFDIQQISDDLLRSTLGGKGLASRLLLENNPPGVNPLDPENHLILATGPVTGTPVWGSCRHGVFTKSPQTGFYSESYAGGTVAEYIVRTGYDVIMIKGSSNEPVWLEVCEEGVIFHSALNLWGLDTYETEDRIKSLIKENNPETKNCGVVCIGPAGENQVSFAVIENDYWRSAGRTGVGAVMGSKKIKAIAFRGNKKKELADSKSAKTFAKDLAQGKKDDPGVKAYKNMGTPMMVDIMNSVESFPTHYWHRGKADHVGNINAPALHERCRVIPHACLKCFIACGRMSTVKEGRHKGLTIEGPEYETIYTFGGLCEVDSIEEIAHLNDICDRLGLDTITAGNLVAFAIEGSGQKKVDYDIDYNQVDKIAKLLEDIAYRRGIGNILAQGIMAAAKAWDMEDQAIHVKGMEPAGYDPRVLKGMGLAYATSDRGACHLRATFYKPELSGMIDLEQIDGKAEMFVEWEDRLTIFDALIFCRFYRDLYQWEELSAIIKNITGMVLDEKDMKSIAGNIADDIRRFNLREGLTPKDDQLPRRFFTEALPESGKVITKDQLDRLVRDYYKARGWDEMGQPSEENI